MSRTDPAQFSEVHLWSRWIDDDAEPHDLLCLLDDNEQARARRFRFERDRTRFVARRAFTRWVLASYVGVTPAMVSYRMSSHGRPELEPPCGVTFSTSHSAGLVVVAVACNRLVGVDIERVRPITDALDLAMRLYSDRESDHVGSVAESDRSEAFLTLWTRKESYVKAVGAGMSIPFDGFDVLTRDGSRIGRPRGHHGDLPFAFMSLDGFDGYIGAVTVSGTSVVTRDMTPTSIPISSVRVDLRPRAMAMRSLQPCPQAEPLDECP